LLSLNRQEVSSCAKALRERRSPWVSKWAHVAQCLPHANRSADARRGAGTWGCGAEVKRQRQVSLLV